LDYLAQPRTGFRSGAGFAYNGPMLDRFDASLDPTFAPVDPARLVAALGAVIAPERVMASRESMRPYESDGLAAYKSLPAAVVLPADADEVAAVLRVCRELGAPIVARGAGTGLSGGALPFPGGVLMGLGKMNRILGIDPEARTARVQPGVRNLAISEAALPYGLFYAPDPSSQLACSIGGNVAENAGGVHCLKYGLTVHNLQSLDIVTMDGERLTLGGEALDAPGFDLMALVTGSEGLLGVITEVTVRLLPRPAEARAMLAAFPDAGCAAQAVADIIAAGITPAGLEMMDSLALKAAEAYAHAGYPLGADAILICECDGVLGDACHELDRVAELCRAAGADEIHIAADEAERQRLWAGRKAAFPAMGRLAADYYCIDGTIPRRELPAVLAGIGALSRQAGLPVANVFHAGDGNLHPLILYDAANDGELERAEALGGAILELCVAVGGTITGEHGVGREKINQMCAQFGDGEVAMFAAIKAAFDPAGLLNPGKAIPTLARCAEFGAMHVHKGETAFAHLPRF
jgi:glycolate oxidase